MQIKYISIFPACVCVCKWNALYAKVFIPQQPQAITCAKADPLLISIKLLRPEQNDRQFVNGSFNFVFSH